MSEAHLQKAEVLPSPANWTTGKYVYDAAAVEQTKEAIYNNGAVSLMYYVYDLIALQRKILSYNIGIRSMAAIIPQDKTKQIMLLLLLVGMIIILKIILTGIQNRPVTALF